MLLKVRLITSLAALSLKGVVPIFTVIHFGNVGPKQTELLTNVTLISMNPAGTDHGKA